MIESDVRDTPPELFAELQELYGKPFQTDVCATHANTKVLSRYFTLDGAYSVDPFNTTAPALFAPSEDGAFGLDWRDDWFCNPPFSALEIGAWVEEAWEQAKPGLMIVPNRKTEQDWWQELVEPYRDGRGNWEGGWLTRLTTHNLARRRGFYRDGKPILNSKGQLGSPEFGITALIWRYAR